jgi:thiol-disulfide isomerase/thioredoxin
MPPGRREALILSGIGLAAAAAGLVVGPLVLQSQSGAASLLSASFTDLSGKTRKVAEWKGRVLVCNFWATWCAPCREEMPLLAAVRERFAPNGVEVLGIAIDSAAKVRQFAASLEIRYPILLAGGEALDLMRDLGNPSGGLPFTVLLDRDGAIAHRRLGLLKRPDLESALERLIR